MVGRMVGAPDGAVVGCFDGAVVVPIDGCAIGIFWIDERFMVIMDTRTANYFGDGGIALTAVG